MPKAYKRIVNIREHLKNETLYNSAMFEPIQVVRHGWPALCAIVYNLWHKYGFNRDNFPITLRPLHLFLHGVSGVGKSAFFNSCVNPQGRNSSQILFLTSKLSDMTIFNSLKRKMSYAAWASSN